MAELIVKNYQKADQVRSFVGHGHLDVVTFDLITMGRAIFEPGFRWSADVKPLAGTESCDLRHTGYCLSGRMHIRMDNGDEQEIAAGDAFDIPAGHDAWVIGDEACVMLDFTAAEEYAAPMKEGKVEVAPAATIH